jgi:hypothetical protein
LARHNLLCNKHRVRIETMHLPFRSAFYEQTCRSASGREQATHFCEHCQRTAKNLLAFKIVNRRLYA